MSSLVALLVLVGVTLPDTALSGSIPDSSNTGLKFGETALDYVLLKPAVQPLEEAFSVCGWVRKLKSTGSPYWFAYGSSVRPHQDVLIMDYGYTNIFNVVFDLRSKVKEQLGNWKHWCVTWDLPSREFTVYYEGELLGSKETASG